MDQFQRELVAPGFCECHDTIDMTPEPPLTDEERADLDAEIARREE